MTTAILLSYPECCERVRRRIFKSGAVLWPTVTSKIIALQSLRRLQNARFPNDEREPRTVTYMKLTTAITTGVVTDTMLFEKPAPGCLNVTFKGQDGFGDELIVMVRLPVKESEPIEITDFTIPQE